MKFQPLCHRQGHQPPDLLLDQVDQGPVQPGLEHLQGWSIHSLSEQPVQKPHHSLCNVISSDIQSKSSLLVFNTISPYPIIIFPGKKVYFPPFYIPF